MPQRTLITVSYNKTITDFHFDQYMDLSFQDIFPILESREVNITFQRLLWNDQNLSVEIDGMGSIHKVLSRKKFILFANQIK
jgi:hypothetical protein